jgi:predicted transcriptional regulator
MKRDTLTIIKDFLTIARKRKLHSTRLSQSLNTSYEQHRKLVTFLQKYGYIEIISGRITITQLGLFFLDELNNYSILREKLINKCGGLIK